MRKATVIEKRDESGYGFSGVEAIIDHSKHGRLLVLDRFGGIDSMQGGAVRFKHRMVVKLHDDDTFAVLDADWNEGTSVMSAVTHGYDDSRPVLEWDRNMITKLAEYCGL